MYVLGSAETRTGPGPSFPPLLPEYQHALTLLEEIKDWLLSLLLPHQTQTQNKIKEKLGIQLIEQQVKSGTLDMHVRQN